MVKRLFSICHYWFGALLFKSGVSGWHPWLHEKTMRQLQRAADQGHPNALALFGALLRYRGATDFNKISGIRYLIESAQKGHADSQFFVAEAMSSSFWLPQYMNELHEEQQSPVFWYIKAAQQEHPMAALRLAKVYHQGLHGTQIDDEKAEYWRAKFMEKSGLETRHGLR